MRFEVQHALQDLDQPIPAYLKQEVFAHGSLTLRNAAIEALRDQDPKERTVRVLTHMLRLT